jgi:nicotinamide-nucleotide amidase
MKAEIIAIGDEILIGQVTDTNSGFIARELNQIGVAVGHINAISDGRQEILDAIRLAATRAQLVILTGGLGPTKDDITKQTLCDFFEDHLVMDAAVLDHVTHLFERFGRPMLEVNRQQAMVPSRAQVLHNPNGTAPGTWQEKNGVVFVSLPGVPYEMKHLVKEAVLPKVVEQFERPYILHRTLVCYGVGESFLADKIETWEDALPENIKLAYLPNLGKVRLRLSASGPHKTELEAQVQQQIDALFRLLEGITLAEEDSDLELSIQKLFVKRGFTLATAESFTGGGLARAITAIPGASAYYKGTVVAYATELKERLLGVPASLIKTHSVVSVPVAEAMALGVQQALEADFAIATTGNAGPSKGDSDEAVGTVCIAIATPKGVKGHQFQMGKNRTRVVAKSLNKAFELLCQEILNF